MDIVSDKKLDFTRGYQNVRRGANARCGGPNVRRGGVSNVRRGDMSTDAVLSTHDRVGNYFNTN